MTFDPRILARVARCFCFLQKTEIRAIIIYLLCQWARVVVSPFENGIIFQDTDGFFWKLIVSQDGNLGLETNPGPKTPDLILDDGSGGLWKFFASTDGNLYTETSIGPAVTNPTLDDGLGNLWQVNVATDGNFWASL